MKKVQKKYSFLKEVLSEITPDYSIFEEVNSFLANLNSNIKKLKIKAKASAGGSIAKGNFLSHDHDIDIFVRFDKKYDTEKLSDYLEKILKGMKAVRLHGSRDYFRIYGKFNYEIVPVLDISKPSEAKNVTDMSPLHVKWVEKMLKKNKELNDEVRLTKQFCKAQKVYGAESYIKGFSGHVVDIITSYYGSFLNLAKNAAKWKEGQVIDYYNAHKGQAHFRINQSKLGPLIVVDPVLPERNASAALDAEKFEMFVKACKDFIKKPSKKFFVRKETTPELLRKANKSKKVKIMCFNAVGKEGKEDITGAKLLKALEFIVQNAEKEGFVINDFGWTFDRKKSAMFYFIMKNSSLPKEKIVEGPPIREKLHAPRFKKMHKKVFSKSGKLYAKEKRKITDFSDFVINIAKKEFFNDKLSAITLIK